MAKASRLRLLAKAEAEARKAKAEAEEAEMLAKLRLESINLEAEENLLAYSERGSPVSVQTKT